MAMLNQFDELNQTEVAEIRKFFEEMELPKEEIEKRIKLANQLYRVYGNLFTVLSAMEVTNQVDEEYLTSYLQRGFDSVYEEYNDEHITDYAEKTCTSVIQTSLANLGISYSLSLERAVLNACNDANSVSNYLMDLEYQAKGYKRKRWSTMLDKHVRKTHVIADGQEVEIMKPFKVGDSQLMYPMDWSLGADAKEIINCRCVCKYLK